VDRYDLVAHGANNGLWDWDLATNRIHFSTRWNSILGYEEGAFGNTAEEWFKRIHPEDLQQAQREIDAHLANGSLQFAMQHRMLHKDGSYRWMSCYCVITRDRAGKAIRIAGSHSDITAEVVVDALTGLPNRLLLVDRLTRSIEITKRRSDFLFAVLILDLDRPESLINRFGSTDGDLLVTAAARRLETCLRAGDTVARPGRDYVIAHSGGDEFIVLIDSLNEVGEAKTVADRLLKEISAPFELNGCEVFLSASIGIALSATGYRNAQEALRDADTALHRAKSLGKGRCEVFDTAILESAQAKLELETDLQRALERQEFAVVYQPIVSLASHQIAGFEALVRWKHPTRGMVSPIKFIPIAERTGLIVPLGRWIMHEACRQLKIWKENPQISRDLWVSINLSTVQFKQPSLVEDIREILLDVDLDANGLMLELTEGGVMDNPEAANRVLMQLRVMGARIGLDDFGTGYASLAHLRRFPLDYLKIDQSFVKSIETNKDAREIIRTISSLAHQLGLRVIAEGIENSGQMDLIRSLDCEYGQGFFFSRGVSSEKAEALLKDGFASGGAENDLVMVTAGNNPETNLPFYDASALPVLNLDPNEPQIEEKRRKLRMSKGPILIGLAAIILLFMGGLLAKFNTVTSPPIVYSSPPSPPSAAETPVVKTAETPAVKTAETPAVKTAEIPIVKTAEMPSAEEVRIPMSADVGPKLPPVIPKPAKKKIPVPAYSLTSPPIVNSSPPSPPSAAVMPAEKTPERPSAEEIRSPMSADVSPKPPPVIPKVVYSYPVVHNHRLGSCKGTLDVTRDFLSYISAKEECSFNFKYSECTYALDHDQLTIRTVFKTYHFKSASALTKEENQSQLQAIIQSIIRLQQEPASKKQ
jgi:diguanylate cyclase (GGDEF)-like protein/PAS domain S-box-containing protein